MISLLHNHWLALTLAAVFGYLLGSINWAIIITRFIFRKDIRTEGSGNAGATNVLRNHGRGAAVLTTVGDVAKSMLAVVMGSLLITHIPTAVEAVTMPQWIGDTLSLIGGYVGGIFCLLGHDFPVFYGFRGGKGVLTTLGMFLLLDWRVALICLGVFIVIVALSRMVSLGSILAIGCGPALLYLFHRGTDPEKAVFCTVAAVIVWLLIVWQHRENIHRIVAGTENRLGKGAEKK